MNLKLLGMASVDIQACEIKICCVSRRQYPKSCHSSCHSSCIMSCSIMQVQFMQLVPLPLIAMQFMQFVPCSLCAIQFVPCSLCAMQLVPCSLCIACAIVPNCHVVVKYNHALQKQNGCIIIFTIVGYQNVQCGSTTE